MKITKQELIDGLATLDPTNDAHWTEDGQPTLEVLQDAVFDDTVTREDIAEHANGFSREIAAEAIAEADAEQEAAKQALLTAPDVEGMAPLGAEDPIGSEPSEGSQEDYEAAVLKAKQALEDHDLAIRKAKIKRDELVATVDRAIKARDALYPPRKQAEVIQDWLASEARKRQERSEMMMMVRAPKSPLDASMERRTGYGGGRKHVPLLAG